MRKDNLMDYFTFFPNEIDRTYFSRVERLNSIKKQCEILGLDYNEIIKKARKESVETPSSFDECLQKIDNNLQ